MWDDLRCYARRSGLAPPHPRDRRELLQSLSGPALTEGAARDCTHLAHLVGAHRDDVSRRTPTAPQPDPGLPPGVEAAVHVRRSHAKEHALAELVAVVAARLAHQPLERGTPVMPDEVLGEELPRMLYKPEHCG
eukprot:6420491-Prorocentrum_lima.AAC.1